MTAAVPTASAAGVTSTSRPTRRRAAALVGAAVASATVWAVAVPLLGVDLAVWQGGPAPQPVGLVMVLAASLVAGLLGWALLALLEKFTSRGRAIWTAVAVVVAVLSLAAPLTSAASPGAALALALMHVVVAAVAVPALRQH